MISFEYKEPLLFQKSFYIVLHNIPTPFIHILKL